MAPHPSTTDLFEYNRQNHDKSGPFDSPKLCRISLKVHAADESWLPCVKIVKDTCCVSVNTSIKFEQGVLGLFIGNFNYLPGGISRRGADKIPVFVGIVNGQVIAINTNGYGKRTFNLEMVGA